VKTRSFYLTWFPNGTGLCKTDGRTDRRTDRITVANTRYAMLALARKKSKCTAASTEQKRIQRQRRLECSN